MKNLAVFTAASLFILLLTKVANQVPPPARPGTAFYLKAQRVVQCSETEITLVDQHYGATHLEKDSSWPECSALKSDVALDFYLSRGEKTHFLSDERTVWWRKAM